MGWLNVGRSIAKKTELNDFSLLAVFFNMLFFVIKYLCSGLLFLHSSPYMLAVRIVARGKVSLAPRR